MISDCLILYGTEGSQARKLAEDLCVSLYRFNITYTLRDLAEVTPTVLFKRPPTRSQTTESQTTDPEVVYDEELSPPRQTDLVDPLFIEDHTRVIILLSTAGQGQMPLSARHFWTQLLKIQNPRPEAMRPYAIFGLGDSKYPFFNFAAKKMIRKLDQLGAVPFARPGLGDDSHEFSHYGELDAWIADLLKTFEPLLRAETTPADELSDDFHDRLLVDRDRSKCLPDPDDFWRMAGFARARVIETRRMTSEDHFQCVQRLVLKLPTAYRLGDVVAVWPRNTFEHGLQMLEALGLDPEARISPLDIQDLDHRRRALLERRTLREVFEWVLDVADVPSRAFLRGLSNCCVEGIHQTKLRELAGSEPDAIKEFMRYVVLEKRCVAEIVQDFAEALKPHALATLRFLITRTAITVPRRYSIASAPGWPKFLATLRQLKMQAAVRGYPCDLSTIENIARRMVAGQATPVAELCVAHKESTTVLQRKVGGVCSSYLLSLRPKDSVYIQVETSPFSKLGAALDRAPLRMYFGTSTGVAPIRAILQDRYLRRDQTLQHVHLGFRRPDRDWLFSADWSRLGQDKSTIFHFAFSRIDESKPKMYIQDTLDRDSQLLKDNPDALIMIAGKSHPMPMQVMDVLSEMLGDRIESKMTKGLLVLDTWG